MDIIDEKGNIFGIINAFDFVVLCLGIVLLSGGYFVYSSGAGSSSDQQTTTEVTIEIVSLGSEYDVEAVRRAQPADAATATNLRSITVLETVSANRTTASAYTDQLYRYRIRADILTTNKEGLLYVHNRRLYVGRQLTLDLNQTIVEGTVISIDHSNNPR